MNSLSIKRGILPSRRNGRSKGGTSLANQRLCPAAADAPLVAAPVAAAPAAPAAAAAAAVGDPPGTPAAVAAAAAAGESTKKPQEET